MVSDVEKAPERCQVGIRKASVSEPLMTCRNVLGGIETGCLLSARDESGGSPFIGQVVSGMEVARA